MTHKRPQAVPTQQIDNDKVIVTEWRFAPGAETGWHKHGYDYIVVPGMDGTLLLETSEGSNISDLRAGQSYYKTAGIEHNVVNASDFEFYFIEIEMK